MCFSAGASFGASAILGSTTLFSVKAVRRPKEYLLALSPLLFCIQQACEGMLWLAFQSNDEVAVKRYSMFFLLFAQIIWPTWVPLSLLLPETDKKRRQGLLVAFFCGVFVSAVFGIRMFSVEVFTTVRNHHIYYNLQAIPWLETFCAVLYVVAIVAAPFISSLRGSVLLGLSLSLSLIVSLFFFNENLISVWCFIAALISLLIIYMLKRQHAGETKTTLN